VSDLKAFREGWAVDEIEHARQHLRDDDVPRALIILASIATMAVEEAELSIPGFEELMNQVVGRAMVATFKNHRRVNVGEDHSITVPSAPNVLPPIQGGEP